MQAIPVTEAVRHAKESLLALYQDDRPEALALEEIELVKDGDRSLWSVTLGFHRRKLVSAVGGGSAFSLAGYGTPPAQVEHRVYKTVFIDASTGEFVKMDIRLVQ